MKIFFLVFSFFWGVPILKAEIKNVRHVYLVRHGEIKNDGTMNPSLSDRGKLRAYSLANHLKRVNIDKVIVSKYRRTKETAKNILLQKNINSIEITDSLAIVNHIHKSRDREIVVIGHSDILHFIIMGLKGPPPIINHDDYSGLYIITLENNDFKGLTLLEY